MSLRIAFMGSPDFSVPTLEAIIAAGHEVACVYSQPPRPAGRGKQLAKTIDAELRAGAVLLAAGEGPHARSGTCDSTSRGRAIASPPSRTHSRSISPASSISPA